MEKRCSVTALQLQNYDNFDSLWDRLNQLTHSPDCPNRVVLIWPKRGTVLRNAVDFADIRSRLARRGVQCAAVSGSEWVRLMGRLSGIPVFPTRQAAEADETPPADGLRKLLMKRGVPQRRLLRIAELRDDAERSAPLPVPRSVEIALYSLLALLLLLTAALLIPRAVVSVSPLCEVQERLLDLWTEDGLELAGVNGGIPSVMETYRREYSVTVPASGVLRGNAALAVGTVRIGNQCETPLRGNVGAELIATESGMIFRLLDSFRLEPAESVNVRVESAETGAGANLPAGSLFRFDGRDADCWRITQEEDFHGETDGFYPTPTEADRQSAQEQIIQLALTEAMSRVDEMGAGNWIPIESARVLDLSAPLFVPEEGYAADTLTLRQTVETGVRVIDRRQMETVMSAMLDLETNAKSSGRIHYTVIDQPKNEDGRIRWTVSARREIYEEKTNEEAVRLMLRGKSPTEAERILSEMVPNGTRHIRLFPQWLPRLPFWGKNIEVEIIPDVPEN